MQDGMSHSQKPKSCPRAPLLILAWVKGKRQHSGSASLPPQKPQDMECSRATTAGLVWGWGGSPTHHLPYLRPLAVTLSWAFRNCEHPGGRITTINVAAKYCKTPNSPICVLPPKRENSLHRHSLIWQANSKPYWQPQACFPNQTAMKPKIVLPALCWGGK